MSSEAVEQWLSDGDRNYAGIFIDDDLKPAKTGWVAVTPDGEHPIYVELSPPFRVEYQNLPLFSALCSINESPAQDVGSRLDQVTAALTRSDDEPGVDGDFDDDRIDDPESRSRCLLQQQMRDAASQFDVRNLNGAAVERIVRDLVSLRDTKHAGWCAAPVARNLAMWQVEFSDFEVGTPLWKDFEQLKAAGRPCVITLALKFPPEYPFKPPFIRVVSPRFMFRTGRVTIGGSICTQMLTEEGWNPTYDIESLLVSIRAQITDPEAGARVDLQSHAEYTEAEAIEAFHRVAAQHRAQGW